jgi:hypothetical protein
MTWREAWQWEPYPGSHDLWGGWAAGGGKGTENGAGGMEPSPDGSWFNVFSNGDTAATNGWTIDVKAYVTGPVRVRTRLWCLPITSKVGIGLEVLRADGSTLSVLNAGAYVVGGTGWSECEYVVQLPADAAAVRALFTISRNGDGNPDPTWAALDFIEIDAWQAEVITGLGGENLLSNGGFRYGPTTGWSVAMGAAPGISWADFTLQDGDEEDPAKPNGGSTLMYNGGVNTSGTSEFRVLRSEQVPVQPGHQYTITGLTAAHRFWAHGGKAYLYIQTYDAAGTRLTYQSFDPVNPRDGQGGQLLEGYDRITGTIIAGPTAAWMTVEVSVLVPTTKENPDDPTELWFAWFDQVGVYDGTRVPAWENQGATERGHKAYPDVLINGRQYAHMTRSASWQMGRSWWFADPEPGTFGIELYGDRLEIEPGAPLVISGAEALFTGVVDDVTVQAVIESGKVVRTTRVTGTDYMGWLARAHVKGWTRSSEDVSTRFTAIATKAKVQITGGFADYAPAATYPPNLPALDTGPDRVSLYDVLRDQEKLANCILQVSPDNKWRIQYRIALGSTPLTRPPVSFDTGDACPYEADLDRQSVDKIINVWEFSDGDEEYTGQLPDGSNSIAKYGPSGYDIPWTKAQAATRYQNAMRFAVAQPTASWNVGIRIRTRANPAAKLRPFDYVEWRGKLYQALVLAYTVSPGEWVCAVHLDATQSFISGGSTGDETTPPDPVPPDQPPPTPPPLPDPPAPTRKRATITVTASQDGYTALSTGGLNAGNGGGARMLVGRLADGVLARGFVRFPTQTFLGRNRTVVSATLTLTTNRGSCMGWGSSPKIKVQRITGSWSEGDYDASSGCGFATSNALKHPGPSVTGTDEVVKAHDPKDSLAVTVSIPGIAQAWLNGADQRGVRLVGYSESSSSNRSAFDCAGTDRAKLSITYEYDE